MTLQCSAQRHEGQSYTLDGHRFCATFPHCIHDIVNILLVNDQIVGVDVIRDAVCGGASEKGTVIPGPDAGTLEKFTDVITVLPACCQTYCNLIFVTDPILELFHFVLAVRDKPSQIDSTL